MIVLATPRRKKVRPRSIPEEHPDRLPPEPLSLQPWVPPSNLPEKNAFKTLMLDSKIIGPQFIDLFKPLDTTIVP